MKAVRIHAQGGPNDLVYEDAKVPGLEPGDALVRVVAASITKDELTWDATYQTRDGKPRVPSIPSHEFAGIVESLTSDARGVRIGDEVYGLASFFRNGSAAEFVAVAASDLAPLPSTVDFKQAATVPLAGLTAWQALFDHGQLGAGQRLLVLGGAGGVGAFAVQLGHWKGAHVVCTASPKNADSLRALGADDVLDYANAKIEDLVATVDLVLDTVGGEVLARARRALRPDAKLVTLSGPPPNPTPAERLRVVFFVVEPNRAQLIELGRLIDAGHLKTAVGEVFYLQDARAAFALAQRGHTDGKVVLRVRNASASSEAS